jgi:hypothetical protein
LARIANERNNDFTATKLSSAVLIRYIAGDGPKPFSNYTAISNITAAYEQHPIWIFRTGLYYTVGYRCF